MHNDESTLFFQFQGYNSAVWQFIMLWEDFIIEQWTIVFTTLFSIVIAKDESLALGYWAINMFLEHTDLKIKLDSIGSHFCNTILNMYLRIKNMVLELIISYTCYMWMLIYLWTET